MPAAERQVILARSALNKWDQSEGWLDAAVAGATLGMELAGAAGFCQIISVHGMVCDTSPGLVVLAAIRAAWAAVAFSPDEKLSSALEACITRGHRLSADLIRAELIAAATQARPLPAPDPARDAGS